MAATSAMGKVRKNTSSSVREWRWRTRTSAHGSDTLAIHHPHSDVVALARTAQRLEPVDNSPVEPDEPLALLVDLVLVADAAERERLGDRIERGPSLRLPLQAKNIGYVLATLSFCDREGHSLALPFPELLNRNIAAVARVV